MNMIELGKLSTEGRNPNTMNIHKVSTLEIITKINEEDKKVALAVESAKEDIARAVDVIAERMQRGGRLIYIGAGTSGRLGILDASECPPTFGVDFETVQGILAGGTEAVFRAAEGSEDDAERGMKDLAEKNLKENDIVCGIAASGRTPYVIGAMKYAREVGAAVLSIAMNAESEMAKNADIAISVVVGPEVIMGSTRMKAGTAQKMIVNMLSTGTMIKLGKVYSNLMVDIWPVNEKLRVRAKRIVKLATEAKDELIEKALNETGYNVKLSIMMLETGLPKEKAMEFLEKSSGYIDKALEAARNSY